MDHQRIWRGVLDQADAALKAMHDLIRIAEAHGADSPEAAAEAGWLSEAAGPLVALWLARGFADDRTVEEWQGRDGGPTVRRRRELRGEEPELDHALGELHRVARAIRVSDLDLSRLQSQAGELGAARAALAEALATPPTLVVADPLAETLRAAEGSARTAELVRYLSTRPGMSATIADVVRDLEELPAKRAKAKEGAVRKQVERANNRLEAKGAPMFLQIKGCCILLRHANGNIRRKT